MRVLEAQEQTTLFQWAVMMSGKWPELRLCHAIPNGGSRNPIEARHLKEQGVKDRQKNRSKTFPGIAKAMADQWG